MFVFLRLSCLVAATVFSLAFPPMGSVVAEEGHASDSYLDDSLFESAMKLPAEEARDDRDWTYPVAYVMTRQLSGLLILSSVDKEKTGFGTFSIENFKEGFRSAPVWEDDEWQWNYLGHPLWGSETFLRARSQNFTFLESFLFSSAASVVWEYGMENWVTHPSKQDLLITSTAGSLIGEIRFRVLTSLVGKEDRGSKLLRFTFDPLQSSTRFFGEKVLGLDWEEPAFRVDPTVDSTGSVGVNGSVTIRF